MAEQLTEEEIRLMKEEKNLKRLQEIEKDLLAQISTPKATAPEFTPMSSTSEEVNRLLNTKEDCKIFDEATEAVMAKVKAQYALNAANPNPSAKKLTSEERRLKRTQENKERWEEIKTTFIARVKARNATGPELSPMKKVKVSQEVDLSAVRRSNQVVDEPPPNNKEMKKVEVSQEVDRSAVRRSNQVVDEPPLNNKEVVIELLGRPRSYKQRDLLNRVYAADEDRQYAKERAAQLQSEFSADFPSFVKPMLQSHVTGGFWLGLPVHFCKTHLPKHDKCVTLEDENGDEFKTKYLALKTGLSGGWRRFSIDHRLVDGDALVFQLIAPTRFKVYIIRVNQAEDSETKGLKLVQHEMNQVKSNHPRTAEWVAFYLTCCPLSYPKSPLFSLS